MKRNLARNTNKYNKEINAQVKTTNAKANDVGNKLLKDNYLTLENINELGQCLAKQQGYAEDQFIVCNITTLIEQLEPHKEDDINEKPIFIICHNKKNTSVTFCIVKLLDQTVCLYKDFLDTQIPENIKDILGNYFGKDIDFRVHAKIDEIEDKQNQDVLSLKTLETMMIYLKPEKRKDFIEGFANPKRTFFSWLKNGVGNLKKELFSLVKEGYYKTVSSDVDQLSRDIEFKKAIENFINNIPLLEEIDNFNNYQTLLKKVVEIEENEINTDTAKIKELEKQLKEAKEKAFSKTKAFKIEISKNEEGDLQLDIVKNFPTQMEKFTKIFEPLIRSTVDEELHETLKEISSKLDLEYDKLKCFFEAIEEKKQDGNYNVSSVKNVEDVISALPKAKSQDTNLMNKPFEKLLSETIENSGSLNSKSLEEGYNKVKEFYELWKNKDALEINQWAVSKKGKLVDSEIYEAISVMDRANELVMGGHKLRDTQILAILTFLQQKNKGQLSEIQTGEGKTTIVSILAGIMALQGETVDVITSNPVLASDGIKDKLLFYNLMNLNATTNNLDENYKSGERECYKSDIVYGSISNFQFDYLKDSFLGLGTRAGRAFKRIILDEVDSMIIDNASHIAKLSGPLPGMESLKYIYIKIWKELDKAEQKIIQEFQKNLKEKAHELNSQKLLDDEAQVLYKEFEDQLKVSIIQKIKNYIKSSNPTKIDIIPSHIQEYADNSLDKWINSAIDAKFNYHEDEQYIICINKDGEGIVQPVDYANTGITLKNTMWQYGLHQFLQLKHNLHLTSESLTSCFISNLGYINKYGDKIFGLTGTLGSKAEQEFLSSIYNVSYAKIPTHKEKKFIESDGEVVDDSVFSEKVSDDIISEIDKNRSSLIICETIKDAKSIHKVLKGKHENVIIKTFFDEQDAYITEEEISLGEVVIATNIAGRGTNFKTSIALENKGGLQVFVVFLPCNKRVEDQAFGRTARNGNNGTAKLIIKKSEVEKLDINSCTFEGIKSVRDLKEKDRIAQIQNIKIRELKFQDRLFELFSALYRKLKKEGQSKGGYKYVLDDLIEFWAFWLEKKNFNGFELANKSPEVEFKNFKFEAHGTVLGEIKFNPYYSIQQAEYFIINEELDKAEQALNHAIKISKNPEILHSAYIKLFEIAIERGRVFIDKCQKAVGDVFIIPIIKPDREYKENAKKYLKQAKEAFKKELDHIESIFGDEEFINIIRSDSSNELVNNTLPNEPQKKENLFLRHIVSKQQALSLNMSHADSLVQQIDNHEGGISIGSRISDYFSNLKPQNDNENKIKNIITNSELSELAAVGTNTTYALREIYDVCPEIAKGAQIQVGTGIALIATGICFPPALPITSAIGGTMITEGICDIAIELINRNSDGKFHKEAYIKGKVISYGVSILTMGINAALQCPKILDKAKKACRWVSKILRKCPFLQNTCEFLATKFDKLGDWFEKIETIAKFSNMSKAEKLKYVDGLNKSKDLKQLKHLGENIKQIKDLLKELQEVGKLQELTHFEKCISTLQHITISTAKSVTSRAVENVIMNKAITPALNSLMSALKSTIREHVAKSIQENIDKEKLKSSSYEDIQNIIKEIRESIDCETLSIVFKDAILGITKHCSNWKVQLGALVIDQCFSWQEVYNYATDLCKKINDKLKCIGKSINQNIDEIINQLIKQLSEELYAQVLSTTVKTCKDVYSVGKSAYTNYKHKIQEETKCIKINKYFKEDGQAGQEQAHALSDVIKRPIHICEENGNIIIIGGQYTGDPIKVSYFPPDENNPTGHYVPIGQGKDWSFDKTKNNCLFDSIGTQIQKDPNELRERTIKQMEYAPTDYYAPYVRDISGTQILLEGGRTNQPMLEQHYPSYKDRIKVATEHVNVLADLRNSLNKYKEEYEKFCCKSESEKLRYLKFNKSIPQFGTNPGKEEMMMGSLCVKFTNGSQLKLVTVSGDSPFSVRQSVSDNKDLTYTKEPILFTWEHGDMTFIDLGKPQGKIYDVYSRQEINATYNKSCAAQKLSYYLGEHMKKNPNLQIKGEIYMAESWYKPGNAKFKPEQVIINKSCEHCEEVLPIVTGANFTGEF